MDGVQFQVYGRVQGVGYRYFAQQAGQKLGLRGWVKNLADGSVIVAAIGPAERLKELEHELRQGPPAARVVQVVASPWRPAAKHDSTMQAFSILHE